MTVTYRPAKFLKKGDTIAFFATDPPTGCYVVTDVGTAKDYAHNWVLLHEIVWVDLGNNGYVEYHPAAPVPVIE